MGGSVTDWAAQMLSDMDDLDVVGRTPEDFLVVSSKSGYAFRVAVLGVKGVIQVAHVALLFAGAAKPELVVNVPSETLWSGSAINRIHSAPAAFGTLGDVSRAARTGNAVSFRNKNMQFYIGAMRQHSNVTSVSYVYENMFEVVRKIGKTLIVAVVEAYNLSAEDVRNARARLGHFDVVVKSSSYGSITSQAEAAAQSMGAEALMFGPLMGRLGR